MPADLRSDLYFSDGQILDEVYVYGSFIQSKIYQAGVTYMDCRNAHTAKLKRQGNSLCAQCHNNKGTTLFKQLTQKNYDDKSHHFHAQNSASTRCAAYHAPERKYIVVDPRRDHSFRVPRPDFSAKFVALNTPNVTRTSPTNGRRHVSIATGENFC